MGTQGELSALLRRQRGRKQSLRKQLVERIEHIGGKVDLSAPTNYEVFAEVWKGLSIPRINLEPIEGECWASLEEGGTIVVKALIHLDNRPIGIIQRRLALERGIAVHELLYLAPPVRGMGLCVALLLASFNFYDELELREVQLEAAMETGRWYWAKVGFEFIRDEDARLVRDWAIKVVKATGVRGLRVDRYTAAGQFARMGGRRKMSLGQIAKAIPSKSEQIEKLAIANDLELDQRIDLGRAVMISGPAWFGRLDLTGPERAAFNAYAAGKRARVQAGED